MWIPWNMPWNFIFALHLPSIPFDFAHQTPSILVDIYALHMIIFCNKMSIDPVGWETLNLYIIQYCMWIIFDLEYFLSLGHLNYLLSKYCQSHKTLFYYILYNYKFYKIICFLEHLVTKSVLIRLVERFSISALYHNVCGLLISRVFFNLGPVNHLLSKYK